VVLQLERCSQSLVEAIQHRQQWSLGFLSLAVTRSELVAPTIARRKKRFQDEPRFIAPKAAVALAAVSF